jgi:Na+-driven multidrug efflux pump
MKLLLYAGLGIAKEVGPLPLYFSIGVSKGMLPLLAYNFSSGNHKRRHDAFIFGCAISLGFSLLCLICYEFFAPALTGLFINDAATIKYGARFLRIMVVAMPMMSVCYPMIIQFQAMGKVK